MTMMMQISALTSVPGAASHWPKAAENVTPAVPLVPVSGQHYADVGDDPDRGHI